MTVGIPGGWIPTPAIPRTQLGAAREECPDQPILDSPHIAARPPLFFSNTAIYLPELDRILILSWNFILPLSHFFAQRKRFLASETVHFLFREFRANSYRLIITESFTAFKILSDF